MNQFCWYLSTKKDNVFHKCNAHVLNPVNLAIKERKPYLLWKWTGLAGQALRGHQPGHVEAASGAVLGADRRTPAASHVGRAEAGNPSLSTPSESLNITVLIVCRCCLPCNHCSNWTWVVKEILAFGTRLRSTHCKEFNYLKLCRPAYFVRTTKLLPHPGHE